jgi:hypothetical protein
MTNDNSETRREVRVIQVDKRCPKRQLGYLRPTGIVCGVNPPVRPHKCNNSNCDYHEIIRGNAYPYIEYLPVEYPIVYPPAFVYGRGQDEFCVDNHEWREEPPYSSEINNYPSKPSGK